MRQIHIGILGAARIAPAAIIQPAAERTDCRIVSVAARDAKRARAYANEHGIERAAASYEDLIGDTDVDLVYNALAPNRHADLTIAALHAGKHVLCEKPFAMNAHEAQRMADAAKATGGFLMEAFHYRFHPAFQRALEIVRSGAIGSVHAIEAEFNVPIPYRKDELRHTLGVGGGALMDLGCYAVHWTRTVAAEEPVVQNAEAKPGREAGIDESMRAELNFPGGITAQIACSMAPDTRFFASLHAAGSKGAMTMINPLHPARGHAIETVAGGETHRETVEGGPTFTYQLAHVLDVIGGRTTLLLPPDDGVANMRVIDAIYTAAGMAPRGGRQS